MFTKVLKKLDKHLWLGLFSESCAITHHSLLKVNQTLWEKFGLEICCWKYRKWGSHLKNRYRYAKVVENARSNFSISPCCTLLFSRKEKLKFFEVPLAAVLCNSVVVCIMNVWCYRHQKTANATANIYLLCGKWP